MQPLIWRENQFLTEEQRYMKKMLLGIAWQVMGFIGAIIILCSAAPHDWDYHGITGIVADVLGLELMIPFLVCIMFFVLGLVFCLKTLNEKE